MEVKNLPIETQGEIAFQSGSKKIEQIEQEYLAAGLPVPVDLVISALEDALKLWQLGFELDRKKN